MREKTLEQYLVKAVQRLGGRAFKWASPGVRGVPDRLVVLPGSNVFGVELKSSGKKPTILQVRMHKELRALGLEVAVVDSREAVDLLLGAL